ncbi:Trp biosynthesis-associated membrane protein [Microbacterium sp.]|uniref:Trp biosynthesis-associated membrane protein n=1 Tax=Microbacterium sp. TaxID=51671 RepID=UPI003A9255D5
MSVAQRGRSLSAVGLLLAGGIGIISSTQTWLTVTRADAAEPILVPGADAMALLAPLSLAILAIGAALTLVGVVLRYVFAALALIGGGLLTWWTAQILFTSPVSAVAPTVTETTGLAGSATVTGMIAAIEPSAWPAIALIGWVILIVTSIFTLLTARRWKRSGRRFQRDAASHEENEGPVDAIDSWDDLSRGSDPTR